VFLIVNLILITYFKPGKPNKMIDLVNHASTIMLIAGAIIWCFLLISRGGKFSLMYGPPSTFQNPDWALVGAMLLTITFYWSTAGLNASDYTRYAKSQSKQSVGQLVGIMVGQTLYIGIGIIIASLGLSANMSIWNPVEISTDFGRIFVSFILISIIITTLKTNVIADQESVNLNLMNLYPRKINWFRAAIISTSIAILMQPWILLENWQSYCNTWILNYSIILAPIIGILTIDYLRRKSNYSIMDLYTANGIYWYSKGFNWNALLALAIGVGIGLTQNYTFGPYSIFPYGPVVSLMVSIGLFLLFSKVSTILAKK
jgi:NCS1 family nucleobase:cation symporter-1